MVGTSPDKQLVEAIEYKNHPFYIGVQYHPEFKSRPNRPHPLFVGLVKASLEKQRKSQIVTFLFYIYFLILWTNIFNTETKNFLSIELERQSIIALICFSAASTLFV